MTTTIQKCLALFVAFSIGAASGSLMARGARQSQPVAEDMSQATNAAFRDGLHLGRLDAEKRAEPHVSVGRWNTDSDRKSFSAGYHVGYKQENYAMQRQQ